VKITIEKDIRKKYHSGFERVDSDIYQIALHGTGGGNSALGCIRWMRKYGRPDLYRKGIALFHYLIDRKNGTYEIINPHNWVYHSSSGRHDQHTIGIELVNPGRDNGNKYTKYQYKQCVRLIDFLMTIFPINSIASHDKIKQIYSGGSKSCPGEGFDWNYFQSVLNEFGLENLKVDY